MGWKIPTFDEPILPLGAFPRTEPGIARTIRGICQMISPVFFDFNARINILIWTTKCSNHEN